MADQHRRKKELKIKDIKTNFEKIAIVIGATGSGKSTIINMLYNNSESIDNLSKPCPTGATSESITKKSNWNFNARTSSLYGDTVGLGDPMQSNEKIAKDIKDLIRAAEMGVSSIIIVMKHGRVTKEERVNLELISQIFSKGWENNCILVVTNYGGNINMNTGEIDDEAHRNEINKWIGEDEKMKEFIHMINGNVILTNLIDTVMLDVIYSRLRKQTLRKLNDFIDNCTGIVGTKINILKKLYRILVELLPKMQVATQKAAVLSVATTAAAALVAVPFTGGASLVAAGTLESLVAAGVPSLVATGITAMSVFLKINEVVNEPVRAGQCSICLSDIFFPKIAQTKCNHIFHLHCISARYENNDENCPECQEQITEVFRMDCFVKIQ